MRIFFFYIFLLVGTFLASCSSSKRIQKLEASKNDHILSHHYEHIRVDNYCGNAPAVRFVDFTYETSDSLRIQINATSSKSEQKITGECIILLDEYELEYANHPTSKLYTETLEIETRNRYPRTMQNSRNLINAIILSSAPKSRRQISEKQYWNTLSITIEPDDALLMHLSESIQFIVRTENCDIHIYPTVRQKKEIKSFLLQI